MAGPPDTNEPAAHERAVAPVVGVALLLAITAILAAVIGSVIIGLGTGPVGEPEVTLSFEVVDGDTVELRHEGGEPLDADEVVVLDSDGQQLEPGLDQELSTGERQEIVSSGEFAELADDGHISIVWQDPRGNGERILATFEP